MENTCGYVYVMINPSYGEDVVRLVTQQKSPKIGQKTYLLQQGLQHPLLLYINDCLETVTTQKN